MVRELVSKCQVPLPLIIVAIEIGRQRNMLPDHPKGDRPGNPTRLDDPYSIGLAQLVRFFEDFLALTKMIGDAPQEQQRRAR